MTSQTDRPKILLVDDRVENLIVLERVLKSTNADFIRALSGNEAIALTLEHEFALALVDVQMPEMDGYEMVELIHQEKETENLPVIFVSAVGYDDFYYIKGIEVGAVDFLPMPFLPELLRGKVNVFLKFYNQRKSIEEAMAVKSQFLSTVSHELRTPLTAIKEGIRLVYSEATGKINDDQKELLGIAKRNVDRLVRLINNVLDFQKFEVGKMNLKLNHNDINEVIMEITETITPLANEKGLEVFTNIEQDIPGALFNRDGITQVLAKLLNNAIKFTEHGSITITTTVQDNSVQVSIQDTGPGIEENEIPKLFHEFGQLSNKKTGGTGLGLAISKKIIQEHDGEIWVESEVGKGSCFCFSLPITGNSEISQSNVEKNINC